jgi:antitoxin (DNA-binding transcriptional repressor) of toxin-antitoxin stability system
VRAGESFEVTHDGVPVALLTPVPRDRVTRLVASGDVRPPRHSRRLHERYPTTTGVSASEALEEDRTGR